jgi:hypothetical protein
MAEKSTSPSTMNTMLGAPCGALGGSKGAQSGTESLMSVLIAPLNGLLIPLFPPGPLGHPPIPARSAQPPNASGSHSQALVAPQPVDPSLFERCLVGVHPRVALAGGEANPAEKNGQTSMTKTVLTSLAKGIPLSPRE